MKIEVIWFTKNRQGENLILNILYTWNQLWFYFYWKVGADTFELKCMHKFYLRHHYQIIFYPNLNSWSLEFPLQFKIGFEGQGIIWRYSNVSISAEFSKDHHSGNKMERHALGICYVIFQYHFNFPKPNWGIDNWICNTSGF